MRFTKILVILLATLTVFGCRKDIDGNTTQVILEPNVPILEDTRFSGQVVDENGNPIVDALVDFTSFTQRTDENGYFRFDDISLNKTGSLINVDKDGFYRGYKFIFPSESNKTFLKVMMVKKEPIDQFDAGTGGTIGNQDASVKFLANSIIDELTQQDYNGIVDVYLHWYNIDDNNTALTMPGDLRAIDAEDNLRALTSYGMVAVELRGANNQKLNLKENTTATISMKAPSVGNLPADMPMWYLDETNGYWIEEGACELVDGNYVAEVSHFSFWNCDYPRDLINLKGSIVNLDGEPIANTLIVIVEVNAGSSGSGYTNSDGQFSGKVPSGVDLMIRVVNECGETVKEGALGNFIIDTSLPSIQIDVLTEQTIITGTVLCNGAPLSSGYLSINYSEGPDVLVEIEADGSFEHLRVLCSTAEQEIRVVAYNSEMNFTSDETNFSFDQAGIYDIGTIDACTQQSDEWMTITADGVDLGFFYGVAASYTENGLLISTADSLEGIFLDFAAYAPVIGDQNTAATQYQHNTNGFYACWYYREGQTCENINLNLTNITKVKDEFITGSFSGLVYGVDTEIQISGEFQIKLDEYRPNAVVRGNVWFDDNENGLQDVGEEGVHPGGVQILQGILTSFSLAPDGSFTTHVRANEAFTLRNSLLQYGVTVANAGDDLIDSDYNVDGQTDPYLLGDGEYLENIGLGLLTSTTPINCEISPGGDVFFCEGQGIQLTAIASSGEPPFTYEWSTGETGESIFAWEEGNLSVIITDATGDECSAETYLYEEYIDIQDPIVTHATCGSSNGIIDFSAQDGLTTIQWQFGSGGIEYVLSDLAPGSYTYIAISPDGCISQQNTVIINDQLTNIGNQVWVENPGGLENIFDAGDLAYEDMEVRLIDANNDEILQTTYTSITGSYLFTGEYSGEYIVEFILPAGYEFVEKLESIEGGNGSDVNPLTGRTDSFFVECGEIAFYVDAGLNQL